MAAGYDNGQRHIWEDPTPLSVREQRAADIAAAQERAFYDPNAKIFDEATRTRVIAELEDPNIPEDKKAILQRRLDSTNNTYRSYANERQGRGNGSPQSDIISTVNPASPHYEETNEMLKEANARTLPAPPQQSVEEPKGPRAVVPEKSVIGEPVQTNQTHTDATAGPWGQDRINDVSIEEAVHGLTPEVQQAIDEDQREKNLDTLNKVNEGNKQISEDSKTVWDSLRGDGGGPLKMMAQAYGGGLGGYLTAASQLLRDNVATWQELGMRHVSRNNQQQLTKKATDDIMKSFVDSQNTVAVEGFRNSQDYLKQEWSNWSKQERDLFKSEFDAHIQKIADEFQVDANRLINQAKLTQEQQIALSALDSKQAMAYLQIAFQAEQNGLDRNQKERLLYAAYQYDLSKIGENKRLEMQLAKYMKDLGVDFLGWDIIRGVTNSFGTALGQGAGMGIGGALAP